MREYLVQDWFLVVGLVSVVVMSIFCQLVMIHNMRKLMKEREKMKESKKVNTHIKSSQSGVAIPCKKVAIPAFTML